MQISRGATHHQFYYDFHLKLYKVARGFEKKNVGSSVCSQHVTSTDSCVTTKQLSI